MSHVTFACRYGGRRKSRRLKAIFISIWALIAQPALAIDLVSTNSAGQQGTGPNIPVAYAISNDGETVLFFARDATLVLGVNKNIYVKTMATGGIVPLIRRVDGLQLQERLSFAAYMDEPPTRVVFATSEPNLSPGVGDTADKILTTEIGSYRYLPARGISGGPAMQFDDFWVNSRLDRIYLHSAGLYPPNIGFSDQIVEISATLATPVIIHSVRPDGLPSNSSGGVNYLNQSPSLSASGDGKIVAWWGDNTDIDPTTPPPPSAAIFIRDTQLGVTRQLLAANGQNTHYTQYPHVSEDGSVVVFNADSVFTPGCNGGGFKTVAFDTRRQQRECISVNNQGEPSDGDSWRVDVSGDGNRVVFENRGTNLGLWQPMQTLTYGVYVRDRRLKRTVRVDVNALGVPGNGGNGDPFFGSHTRNPRISKNGRWVVFNSDSSNLVPNDTNGFEEDVFRVDLNRFLPDPTLGTAPLVPVPSLSPLASLLLIFGVLGFGIWVRRE